MGDLFFKLGRSLGYATIPALRKTRSAWQSLVGNEAESVLAQTEFGRAMAAELRLKVRLSNDDTARALLREVLVRLSAQVRNKDRTFQIDVLEDPTPAAMALPGGFLFVSTGMVDFCQRNPHELAFLIGHEMGHVVRGHALERVLTRIGVEGLSAVLSRGLLNPVLREAGLRWLENPHAPEAELEADEFGARIAWAAGYESSAVTELFKRFSAWRVSGKPLGHFLSSHPAEAERMARIKEVWRSLGGREGG